MGPDRERVLSHAAVRRVGVDEASLKRGHPYLTLYVDLDGARVLFATEGREANTFRSFREDLEAHEGHPDRIWEVCVDMSPAYRQGQREHLPHAQITFDRFHVVKLLNQAVDQVRRAEGKEDNYCFGPAPRNDVRGPERSGEPPEEGQGGDSNRLELGQDLSQRAVVGPGGRRIRLLLVARESLTFRPSVPVLRPVVIFACHALDRYIGLDAHASSWWTGHAGTALPNPTRASAACAPSVELDDNPAADMLAA